MTQLVRPDLLKVSNVCLDLIKSWEGLVDGDPNTVPLDVYLDPVGLPTIGWGHLLRPGEAYPNGISKEQADDLLLADITHAEKTVRRLVKAYISQEQFDALVCFVYNIGIGAFQNSTLLKKLNRNSYHDVPGEMLRWIHAGGKPSLGLINRRLSEAKLFASGINPNV